MLNRRILRIKAFKVLYANALTEKMSLAEAEVQLSLTGTGRTGHKEVDVGEDSSTEVDGLHGKDAGREGDD